MDLGLALAEQFDAAVDQQRAENIDDPVKSLDQAHAGDDENRPHDQRAQDSPEQDLVLVAGRHLEITEDQQEDE